MKIITQPRLEYLSISYKNSRDCMIFFIGALVKLRDFLITKKALLPGVCLIRPRDWCRVPRPPSSAPPSPLWRVRSENIRYSDNLMEKPLFFNLNFSYLDNNHFTRNYLKKFKIIPRSVFLKIEDGIWTRENLIRSRNPVYITIIDEVSH